MAAAHKADVDYTAKCMRWFYLRLNNYRMKSKIERQNDLIEQIIEWYKRGKPLGYSNAQECINDYEKLVSKTNDIHNVSQQRELLLAYEKFRMGHTLNATEEWHKENVELFLANNCC